MLYEFEDAEGVTVVDTQQLDYETVWDAIGLKSKQRKGANRIIDLYHSDDFNQRILVFDRYSWLKPYNREAQRHQADHYKTRTELEGAAQDNKLVRKLIHEGILEPHPNLKPYLVTRRETERGIVIGPGHKRHPQATYRLNVATLCELESA